MSLRTLIWIIIAIIGVSVISCNARMQFNSAKKKPERQYIEEANITITAPALEKKTVNETQIKETQKDTVEYAAVYGTFYKKTEYSVIYTLYKNEIDIDDAAQNVINLFADKSFKHNIYEDKEGIDEKVNIDGVFEINGKSFGAKIALIKRNLNFWQIVAVYPHSDDNIQTAENYINSVIIDDVIEHKAEKKQ
ncbi:MAG: hypothetical protein FWH43_06710 [Endomicrobia bacterium]|nr:hypothetical protein [Endomicrobiia bacterium]